MQGDYRAEKNILNKSLLLLLMCVQIFNRVRLECDWRVLSGAKIWSHELRNFHKYALKDFYL